MNYLPEYYYWDGVEPVSAGCPYGGAIDFAADGDKYAFTLNACAFTHNFIMTGPGRYDPNRDRFTLDVTLLGRWRCTQKYVRTGDHVKVTGACP